MLHQYGCIYNIHTYTMNTRWQYWQNKLTNEEMCLFDALFLEKRGNFQCKQIAVGPIKLSVFYHSEARITGVMKIEITEHKNVNIERTRNKGTWKWKKNRGRTDQNSQDREGALKKKKKKKKINTQYWNENLGWDQLTIFAGNPRPGSGKLDPFSICMSHGCCSWTTPGQLSRK